jgi:mannose-6-phosphate isomerase-like protein (cupin superfamily)
MSERNDPARTAALSQQYVYFLDDDAFHDTDRPGFRRRVVTGDSLQLCFWRIAGGATGSVMHHHTGNEQLGIVVRGALDFRIGAQDVDERTVLRAGDVYLAPLGVWHGDSVFIGDDEYGECWILDVFAPPRDDLRAEG